MIRKDKINRAKQYLQEEILACSTCRPWAEDETVWFNPHTDLYNLLIDFDLTDEEWNIILNDLKCPNCGQPLETKYDEVEIKSNYDHKVELIFKRIEQKLLFKKLYEFNVFLSKYPYLGLNPSEKTGKQIFNLVKNGKKHSIKTETWYRARKLNNDSRIFFSKEMKAPDPNKVYIKEGRYNHTGQSFLYLSSLERTAFLEIKEDRENVCVIQQFRLSFLDNVLDLRSNYSNIDPDIDLLYWAIIYNGFISNKPNYKSSWKPEYFIPRFIADAARYFNYNGIIYTSAVSHDGDNLVIFDSTNTNIEPIGKPYIYKNETSQEQIFNI